MRGGHGRCRWTRRRGEDDVLPRYICTINAIVGFGSLAWFPWSRGFSTVLYMMHAPKFETLDGNDTPPLRSPVEEPGLQ